MSNLNSYSKKDKRSIKKNRDYVGHTHIVSSQTKERIPVVFLLITSLSPSSCFIHFPRWLKGVRTNYEDFYKLYHVREWKGNHQKRWYHALLNEHGVTWSGGKEEAKRLGVEVKDTYKHFLPILTSNVVFPREQGISEVLWHSLHDNPISSLNYMPLREQISKLGYEREAKFKHSLDNIIMAYHYPLITILTHASGYTGEGDIWILPRSNSIDWSNPTLEDCIASIEVLRVYNGNSKPFPCGDHFDLRNKTSQRLYDWKDKMLSYNVIPVIAFGSTWKEEEFRWSILTNSLLDKALITIREFGWNKKRVRKPYLRKRIVPIAPLLKESFDTQGFLKKIKEVI
jgi:hypothetical protein